MHGGRAVAAVGARIITGGPGVGKTTIIQALVRGYEETELDVTLLAPTGRASKRMREVIGRPASTIHRLLYSLTKALKEGTDLDSLLIRGIVIVDEVSMLDIVTFAWLLSFLYSDAVLVLVGDQDQLPSVGPGSVLRDLLRSQRVAATVLTRIFRQAEGSDIIKHAHAINHGLIPPLARLSRGIVEARGWPDTDFYLCEIDDQAQQAQVALWAATQMAQHLGFDSRTEVQVLTPMRKGEAGVINLNTQLQAALNPDASDTLQRPDGSHWGIGDRVMQLKNNYEYGIFNGDQGIVREFHRDAQGDVLSAVIEFDENLIEIDVQDFHHLVLAYAVTVHKSQGSEFPMVVMCLHTAHFTLLQRNLLYTGITRSRQAVVLVANAQALSMAVHNNQVAQRNTFLTERLDGAEAARAVA